jgi:hypothetical protein
VVGVQSRTERSGQWLTSGFASAAHPRLIPDHPRLAEGVPECGVWVRAVDGTDRSMSVAGVNTFCLPITDTGVQAEPAG